MATQKHKLKTSLPEQYTVRATTIDDAEAVAEHITEVFRAKGYQGSGTADELRVGWQEPDFKLEDSSIVIEDESGKVVANATLWDISATPVHPWCGWELKEELYGTEVETFILNWYESKAQRVIEKCPPEARIALQTNTLEGYEKRAKALSDAGYTHSRSYYRMAIEMDEAPPEAQLPPHIIIRGMSYPDELRAITMAIKEGFKDHWGFIEEPIEEELKFWTHYTKTDKIFKPEHFFLAIDTRTDTVAGIALCRWEQVGKPETAYVQEFAVMPDYRRQGLGLTMLHHAFGEFYKQGRKQVALHVDTDSLTGATRVYGKAGMKPVETWMNYEKVLRDGVEISTTSLD